MQFDRRSRKGIFAVTCYWFGKRPIGNLNGVLGVCEGGK